MQDRLTPPKIFSSNELGCISDAGQAMVLSIFYTIQGRKNSKKVFPNILPVELESRDFPSLLCAAQGQTTAKIFAGPFLLFDLL